MSCAVSRTATSRTSTARVDPIRDIETIETELMLADLESLEKRVVNLEKKAKGGDKESKEILALVERCARRSARRQARRALAVGSTPEERKAFAALGLLSSKPVLYVCNVEEAAADAGNEFSESVSARAKEEGAKAVVVSAKIESEIAICRRPSRRTISRRSASTSPASTA